MKSPYIKEAEINRNFTTSLLVRSKEIREKKTGEPYLSLSLCDRSGEIEAKMWDNVAEVMDTFERDDFVKVKGLIQIYHNRPQLTIHKMRRMEDSEGISPTISRPRRATRRRCGASCAASSRR